MNIIIVGCGRVGRSIAEQLNAEGHSITVIDRKAKALDKLTDTQNVMTIVGNGATYGILKDAGIKDCDLLIAVTAADELNLYTCLIAKNAGVDATIARVRNPEYIHDVEHIKDHLKLSLAINPEYTCAREMARLVKFPGAVQIASFAGGMIDLITVRIEEGSPLSDKRVADCSSLFKGGVRISLIERDGSCYIPNGDFELHVGDLMSFSAPSAAAAKLLRTLGHISSRPRSVMILGGSKIAFYLSRILREAGVSVKIVERDMQRCEELSEDLQNVMVIYGNAMDESILVSEGIDRADGVVCLMNNDEENVLASLYARKVNPNARVITELGNTKFSSIYATLPLDSVIRPKQLTGESIVRYVRGMQNTVGSNVETMYKINGGEVEALEFRVREESAVTGKPISQLNLKSMLNIVCIGRNKRVILPTGSDTIEVGDTVIVITKHRGLSDLRDILK